MEYKQAEYLNAFPSYLENSVLKPRPFYHTDFNKSIEKIVLDEPEEPRGLADRIFSDKSKTLKSTIKALFNEVNLRERLDGFLLYQINEDICKCKNYLNQIKLISDPYRLNPNLTGRRTKLESEILRLEVEKRKTYHDCWKELFELKKELLSGLKDYWLVSKRKSALNLEDDKDYGCREYMQEVKAYTW